VLTFLRRGEREEDVVVVCLNFTPEVRDHYRVGVPRGGAWREVLNSDAVDFGGGGKGNLGRVTATPIAWNGRRDSISITVPPLGAVFFKPER
jgi:1,4-alpha-glucan branching enzyme